MIAQVQWLEPSNLSNALFAPEKVVISPPQLSIPLESNSMGIESPPLLEQQEEGGFVAFSREYPEAVGQGETEEEAISDLQEAIQLLKEVLEENKVLQGKR